MRPELGAHLSLLCARSVTSSKVSMDVPISESCKVRQYLLEVDLRPCLDMLGFARHNGSFGRKSYGDDGARYLFLMGEEMPGLKCFVISPDGQKLS